MSVDAQEAQTTTVISSPMNMIGSRANKTCFAFNSTCNFVEPLMERLYIQTYNVFINCGWSWHFRHVECSGWRISQAASSVLGLDSDSGSSSTGFPMDASVRRQYQVPPVTRFDIIANPSRGEDHHHPPAGHLPFLLSRLLGDIARKDDYTSFVNEQQSTVAQCT